MSSPRSTGRSILALVLFLAIAAAVAALGSIATAQNVEGWYAEADKAPWTPPGAVFGPVWTVLYALMSVAAWLIWREPDSAERRRALGLYVAQLVLNALWTPVFFGLYPTIGVAALWAALVIIVALDVLVLLTALRFRPVRRLAAVLLIPYGAWLAYATTLNAAAAVLNP
ncbi:MAG: tryptophan-rich sensory protein [Chloroflexota bacterium]|nr:tryptophan-rich sensory protein [Chloroflexota bacterium]